jgi:hypothetical protein
LVFKEKTVDFGGLAVGIPVERTVVIKNVGSTKNGGKGGGNPTAFYCDSPAPGVTVKPDRGFIGPGQSRELTVVCKPPREHVYKGSGQGGKGGGNNSVVFVRPRGGRPAVLDIVGDAVVPEVHVLEEEIEFGGVTIGATLRSSLRLENRGTIPAVLFIDLERHPEFSVEMDPKQLAAQMAGNKDHMLGQLPGIDETALGGGAGGAEKDKNQEGRMVASLIPVTDIRVGLSTASTKGGGGGGPPSSASSAATTTRGGGSRGARGGKSSRGTRGSPSRASEADDGSMNADNQVARKFKATIPVGECLQLLLVFAPQSERTHVFELPLILAGQHQRRAPEPLQRVIR